ncbi:enoyl-CoA hydratase-related protein [Amycolatopsis sp. YIM 10]|uniref:enoyl-CoA hydratase-related protein n=1 Tax=Amycolatopsis sp. YIM 10 TaxID=2653857 RepID=UPI0012900829|nr:enoyl-CoA hydratase-related protein [Amycolatopsis sp. YIM 10]QFU88869.1 1,2-epoxyphenylacetyl-CoA isomerase [Amycolatopsis sp. YIM 10]
MSETTLAEGIRYTTAAGVGTLTFERPDRHNAMDPAMRTRYGKVLREAEQDPAVRAVVVTGSGRSFCPGADLEALAGIGTTGVADEDVAAEDGGYADVLAAATVAKPVVAAINGGCAGLGFVVACAADVRFAAAGAKFTTAFVRRGLIAEYGIAKLLPELVGRGRALDLLLSGRTFTAEQALDYGLVQEVLPPDELLAAATAYAGELATYSAPRSMALIKEQLRVEAALPLAESARRATGLMIESFGHPELAEGVRSWNERRPPAFPPYPSES